MLRECSEFHLNLQVIEKNMTQLPSEILDVFVSEGVCTKADLSTIEIKPLDGGGVTDFVDGSSPNVSFEVSFRGGYIRVFVKVNFSLHAYPSFNGEFHSLKAINRVVPQFAPTPLLAAPLTSTTGGYLITTYVHMSRVKPPKSHILLARLLSRMHVHRSENGKFGFPVQTMCRPPPEYKDVGEVWTDTWEEYFRDVMMMGLIKKLTKSARERDIDSVDMARKVTEQVVPKLLGELGEVEPVLLHSDLWDGNWAVDEKDKPVVFDPACFYGHNEFELTIMRLWGIYTEEFWKVYHSIHSRREPYFNERQRLYMFFVQLHHLYYFGTDEYRIEIGEIGKDLINWAHPKENQ